MVTKIQVRRTSIETADASTLGWSVVVPSRGGETIFLTTSQSEAMTVAAVAAINAETAENIRRSFWEAPKAHAGGVFSG